MAALLLLLTFLALLGSALIAGVFFAFSTFVMRALARLPAPNGIEAMQSINIAVINPLFLGPFFATAALCIFTAIAALFDFKNLPAIYLFAGSILYFVGTFIVTIACNVPLNNSLAALIPTDAHASARWEHYLRRWTLWNHIRTAAAIASAACFALALYRWP